jgi:hypothetical protein
MADINKAGMPPVEPPALPFDQREPQHKAFEWADPGVSEAMPARPAIMFFNMTRDITEGAATALQILEGCRLAEENHGDDERPLLSLADQGALMRLVIGSLGALSAAAENCTEWVNTHGEGWKARELAQRKARGAS